MVILNLYHNPQDRLLFTGEGFLVDIWQRGAGSPDSGILCHLWCNSRGDTPVPLPELGEEAEIVRAIVEGSHQIWDVDFGPTTLQTKPTSISPVFVYRSLNLTSPMDCDEEKCSLSHRFVWKRRGYRDVAKR